MNFSQVKLAGLCGLFITLSACSNIDGQSLLSNAASDPTTHNVDGTPSESDLYLKADATFVRNAATKAEMSGSCFISTYPSHQIRAVAGSTSLQIIDINGLGNGVGSCKNGRFNVAIYNPGFASGTKVNLILEVFDSSGAMKTYNVPNSFTLQY